MRERNRPTAIALAAVLALGLATETRAKTSGDFCVLSVQETGGGLAIVDPAGVMRAKIALGERPHEIAVSPDRHKAYVSLFGITDYDSRLGSPGITIAEIDLASARQVGAYDLPADLKAPHGVVLRPPGFGELFTNTEAGGEAMLVFDRASHRVLRRFPLPAGSHNFVFSKDGAGLFVFAGANGVYRIDPVNGAIRAHADLGSPVRGLRVAPDGAVLAGARGEVLVLNAPDLSVAWRLASPKTGQFVYLEETSDGAIVAPSLNDDGVVVFSRGGAPGQFIATGKTPIQVRRGPDDRLYVSNVNDTHLSVIDPKTLSVRAIGGMDGPNGLAFGVCPRR